MHCVKSAGKIVTAVLAVVMALAVTGCSPLTFLTPPPQPYKETQIMMDTVIEITAYGPNKEAAVAAAFAEFKHIQAISDHFDPASQLSKINQQAGIAPVKVDNDLVKMIEDAKAVSARTNGAFDISIGPVTELWGIGHKGDFVPAQAEINKVLPLVDYRLIQVDAVRGTVYLTKAGMKLDLGGVAKDYALNKATDILRSYGIQSALLNAGGDIQVIGTRPDHTPWRIGVQDPRKPDGIVATVVLDEKNVCQTSGDYQRFFIKDGVRYAHILDPKTGRQPTELASVTLVYKDSDVYKTGDIASSGFMVLGLEKAMKALRQFPGVEAVFVTTDGKVVVTPGLKETSAAGSTER